MDQINQCDARGACFILMRFRVKDYEALCKSTVFVYRIPTYAGTLSKPILFPDTQNMNTLFWKNNVRLVEPVIFLCQQKIF
jgi:hypothetical protein